MIVLDASILANLVGDDEDDGDLARSIFDDASVTAIPQPADLECLSVLRKRWLAGMLTDDRLTLAVRDLNDLPLRRYPVKPMLERIIELRHNVTPYDAAYVALAEALDSTLVTCDKRLAKANGPACRFRVISGTG